MITEEGRRACMSTTPPIVYTHAERERELTPTIDKVPMPSANYLSKILIRQDSMMLKN